MTTLPYAMVSKYTAAITVSNAEAAISGAQQQIQTSIQSKREDDIQRAREYISGALMNAATAKVTVEAKDPNNEDLNIRVQTIVSDALKLTETLENGLKPAESVASSSLLTASAPNASAPNASAPNASAPTASGPTAPTASGPTAPTASAPVNPGTTSSIRTDINGITADINVIVTKINQIRAKIKKINTTIVTPPAKGGRRRTLKKSKKAKKVSTRRRR